MCFKFRPASESRKICLSSEYVAPFLFAYGHACPAAVISQGYQQFTSYTEYMLALACRGLTAQFLSYHFRVPLLTTLSPRGHYTRTRYQRYTLCVYFQDITSYAELGRVDRYVERWQIPRYLVGDHLVFCSMSSVPNFTALRPLSRIYNDLIYTQVYTGFRFFNFVCVRWVRIVRS